MDMRTYFLYKYCVCIIFYNKHRRLNQTYVNFFQSWTPTNTDHA